MRYFNKHFPPPIRIDLGCGAFKREGYIGIDNFASEAQWSGHPNAIDLNWDLMQGVPFRDSTVAEIYSSHFLEHVNWAFMIRQIHRVAAPDAKIHLVVPYGPSAEGMYPGHVNFLTEKFFNNNPFFQSSFEAIEYRFDPTPEWESGVLRRHLDIPFDVARLFLFNVCWQMHIMCRPKGKTAPAAEPAPGEDVVIRSLSPSSVVYLFRIEDSAGRRCEFEDGYIRGKGRVFLHPDQKVQCVELVGLSSYEQELLLGEALTFLFFATPRGGTARVEWRGAGAEVDLTCPDQKGEWRRLTVVPAFAPSGAGTGSPWNPGVG